MTRKRMLTGLGSLLVVAVVVLGAVGWYYAGEIKNGALVLERDATERDLTVTAVGGGQVTLTVTDDTDLTYGNWQSDGIYGIDWDGGFAQAGEIIEVSAGQVTREFTAVSGELAVGLDVSMGGAAFDGDPNQAHGIPFEDITVTSDLGDFDAWLVAGDVPTWVIYTHGKGASREEALRMLPTVTDLGFFSLVITYRNDEGAPTSDSGFYDYGLSEWRELEAAVRYALDHGAQDVVLVGYSMGGAITMNFLYESSLAGDIDRVVLDAPMTDFGDVIDYGGDRRGLPGFLTSTGKFVAGLRFGIDWGALDYLDDRVDELDAPVLLFHGDQDRIIHQRLADELASARPDLVTYVDVADAGHVRAWNVARARYEAAVVDFLEPLR